METHKPHGRLALVLGAGVIGLSTASVLLRDGYTVKIIAKEPPLQSTSSVAPAMWHPYKVSPDERMREWAHFSFATYKQLASDLNSGVLQKEIREYYASPALEPWYASAFDVFRRLESSELPRGYTDGFTMDSFVIDTQVYLSWLAESLRKQGVVFEYREVESFEEFMFSEAIAVNCTGLGARTLAYDDSMYPIRGQVERVHSSFQSSSYCVIDENGPHAVFYAVPRSGDVLLGGTADEHEWDTQPHASTTKDILRKAKEFVPELFDADSFESLVGLRPARPTIRLERDTQYPWLIHNYGHSGAGFTLAWGCAQEALRLVQDTYMVRSTTQSTS